MLLKYYKTIPRFSGDAQTVRNYVCLCKTSFKKVIFFGLLRVLMMSYFRFLWSLFFLFSINNLDYIEVHTHQFSSTMDENYESYYTITQTFRTTYICRIWQTCFFIINKDFFFSKPAKTDLPMTLTAYLSHIMRKMDFCICKNKDTDDLCSNCTADQSICFATLT